MSTEILDDALNVLISTEFSVRTTRNTAMGYVTATGELSTQGYMSLCMEIALGIPANSLNTTSVQHIHEFTLHLIFVLHEIL
jgi:hypothetical protein